MTKEELYEYVEQEIQWLRYYAHISTREKLTIHSNIYSDLISIGYTKVVMPLWSRCAAAILTADKKIDINICLSDLKIVSLPRNLEFNQLTALEIYWIMFLNERQNIINKLK